MDLHVSDEARAAGFILKHDNRIRTMFVQTVSSEDREERTADYGPMWNTSAQDEVQNSTTQIGANAEAT